MKDEGVVRSRRLKKWFVVFILCGAVFLFVVFLLPALRKGEEVYRYETARMTKGELVVTVTADGNLKAKDQVEVGTEISGTVREVKADFNQKVKKGKCLQGLTRKGSRQSSKTQRPP